MTSRSFVATITGDENSSACAIELPFDPKEVWGLVRQPVLANVGGHSYRTTVASMRGMVFIPLNRENREAAGVAAGDRVEVTLEPDTAPRVIDPPPDLARALEADPALRAAWDSLSYTHQKEHAGAIEEAKREQTRQRRLDRTIRMLKKA